MTQYIDKFASKMVQWHKSHGRHHLPWQKMMTPYRIWISEIMLQQTQVATVIPYFERFMIAFPSLIDLANASLDEVIKLWAGLGYYSRAKHLHQTAKCIVRNYQNQFPNTLDELIKLPGIGQSTAGAILAFAFNKHAAILDGNVKRIFIRLHGLEMTTQGHNAQKQLWQLAEYYLPKKNIQAYTQSLMDLGAMICLRKNPHCQKCPLISDCLANQRQITHLLPLKTERKKLPKKKTFFLLFKNKKNQLLLEKRPPVGIWSNLWSFPEIKSLSHVQTQLNALGFKNLSQQTLPTFKHTFSHFHLEITPMLIEVAPLGNIVFDPKNMIWILPEQYNDYGLPKPATDLLRSLTQHEK